MADRCQIVESVTGTGRSRLRAFVSKLGDADAAEAVALIKALAEFGSDLRMPRSRHLGGGLFELRGRQVRIFYVFSPLKRAILLEGIVKKKAGHTTRRVETNEKTPA